MRSCQACGREFAGRSATCWWCGFNNASHGGPRSARALAQLERDRQEQAEFDQELEELGNEFAALLCRHAAVEQGQPERSVT